MSVYLVQPLCIKAQKISFWFGRVFFSLFFPRQWYGLLFKLSSSKIHKKMELFLFRSLNCFQIKIKYMYHFYAPPPESGGVLCYTLRNFECLSVRPSVCLSVRPSAPTTILVSATPPTVLGQSFWNFTGVLRMVWRYAYCFFRILKLFFITFFPFLT